MSWRLRLEFKWKLVGYLYGQKSQTHNIRFISALTFYSFPLVTHYGIENMVLWFAKQGFLRLCSMSNWEV